MHSFILSLLPVNLFSFLFFTLFLIEVQFFALGERLGPLWKPTAQLPPWPRVWRVMFWLFPEAMTFLFPPIIGDVPLPEVVEFESRRDKRRWLKRFPELREPEDAYKAAGRRKSTEPNIEDALPF
jgi:hypothetical protein